MLHQDERIPLHYKLQESAGSPPTCSITLQSLDDCIRHKFDFRFEAIRSNVFRTTFSSPGHPIPPYGSVKRPKPSFPDRVNIFTDLAKTTRHIRPGGNVTAMVEWSGAPVVSLFLDRDNDPIHKDLPFRSYAMDNTGIAHYMAWKKDTLHVGLGEKAAPMNLNGRGFIISASDTFGYDAYRTDPLYKHVPLLINMTRKGCVGVFSTSHSRATWAVGSEIDGLWGPFKVYRQAHGGLEEYLIVGKTVEEVVYSYAELVGFPLLVPRYMMGYIGGGMKYSMEDCPRAADSIIKFIERCSDEGMPVSAFQLSSGYTMAVKEPKTRNVFTWNRHRFPNTRAFTKACHKRGVRILANVKPYVLATHPEYIELHRSGAFFKDPLTQTSAIARLWSAGGGESGTGSHIDFTSVTGSQWWYLGCGGLKEDGIDGIWNDNNEFNMHSDDWQLALETVAAPKGLDAKHIGLWGRAMHTELMAKVSHDACVDLAPSERPLVLTRSATAGTMRYACCSWGGDNVTSWESMMGGNALALNAGFSLLQCYGHDIGGFEGPQPTAELMVRWVQLGIHSPRFAINCYKTTAEDNLVGEVIEPWQFPTAKTMIRDAIKRRYELVPYTYSLALLSHTTAVPPQRWTGWGYESDPNVWTEAVTDGDTQYWFGDALLVAGVYEPGRETAKVYLPRAKSGDFGFLNTNRPYQHLESGRWHTISSAWQTSIPVLARCGSAVPIGISVPTTCRHSDEEKEEFAGLEPDVWRGVEIFPPPLRATFDAMPTPVDVGTRHSIRPFAFASTWLEDDGISSEALAEVFTVRVVYATGKTAGSGIAVKLDATKKGLWEPLWLKHGVDVVLPVGEERELYPWDSRVTLRKRAKDHWGRRIWNVGVEVNMA